MTTTLAIIQARTSSSRLPGKVLRPVLGRAMILHQIERVSRCSSIDQIVLATSDHASDDALAATVTGAGFTVFRGDLDDVLLRFNRCSQAFPSDTVVRLTGDCPLSDPTLIDEVVQAFHHEDWDYLSNSADEQALTVPDGCDVEVFRRHLLEQAAQEAALPSEREHVTPWMRRPELPIRAGHYRHRQPRPFFRLTVDDPQDFTVVEAIYEALHPANPVFGIDEVIAFLQRHPDLANSNLNTVRNEGYLKSLQSDS